MEATTTTTAIKYRAPFNYALYIDGRFIGNFSTARAARAYASK